MVLSFGKNKLYHIIPAIIFAVLYFSLPAPGESRRYQFSEINLQETDKPDFFLDAVKTEDIKLKNNYFGKDRFQYVIDKDSDITGLIELDIKKDKSALFYEGTGEKIDAKMNFSKDIAPFMEFNTEITAEEINNRSNSPMEIVNFNVSTNILPYHKIYFGQASLSDGSSGSLAIFDTMKNQYNLNSFESAEDIDLKLTREKGFINYSAGAYNINKKTTKKGLIKKSSVAGGYASINPLYNLGKLGDFEVGGGYFTNQYAIEDKLDRENAYSVFTGYKFSRFTVRGEFLREKSGEDELQSSDSWHFSNKFSLTDTFKLKTGFKAYKDTDSTESKVGFEYNFKDAPIIENEHLKLEFDATYRRGQEWGFNDSERFGIMTRYQF